MGPPKAPILPPMADSMDAAPRKRNRLSLSCNYCKKRKVKCDRVRPCSSCIKYNVADLCDFPANLWQVSEDEPETPAPDISERPMQLQFKVQPSSNNRSERAEISWAENGNGIPKTAADNSAHMVNELSLLKAKIRLLEAQIPASHLAASHTSLEASPVAGTFFRGSWPHDIHLPPLESFSGAPKAAANPTYVGINPYDEYDDEDTINFYEGYTPIHVKDNSRQMNFGPYSWLSILKKDQALLVLWKVMVRHQSGKKTMLPLPDLRVKADEAKEDEFRGKVLAQDGYDEMRPFQDGTESRQKHNKHARLLGLTQFEGNLDQETHLIEKIRLVLPNQRVVWILINRFFKYVYPFFPFLDETHFTDSIKRILGPEAYVDRKIAKLNVEKRHDFANLGILLIVLRMSYLSSFSNLPEVNADNMTTDDPKKAEIKYLLNNPVDIDVIAVAQACLDQFDVLRKTNLNVLQFALFMRIYEILSPEEGDGADGGNSQVFNSILIQMAYSIGIHREPDNFSDVCNDAKTNNLTRKIWSYLLRLDTNHVFQYGSPMCIDDDFSDVLEPFHEPGNENTKDLNMEKDVMRCFTGQTALIKTVRRLLKVTLNVKSRIPMADLTQLVSKIEVGIKEKFGVLSDYTRTAFFPNESSSLKVYECKTFLTSKNFLNTTYFYFYLHYEKKRKNSLAFFYLKKLFCVIYGEFAPEYLELIHNNLKTFDPNSTTPDFILNPTLELMIHKLSQFNFAILIRLNFTIYKLKSNHDYHNRNLLTNFAYRLNFAKLCKLSKMVEKFVHFGTSCISRLSNRYYYAWRVSKTHAFLVKLLVNQKFYENFVSKETGVLFLELNNDQLNELIDILHQTMKKIKNVVDDEVNNMELNGSNVDEAEADRVLDAPELPNPDLPSLKFNTTPLSTGSLDLEEFQYEADSDIDKLWMQMLQSRQNQGPPNELDFPDSHNSNGAGMTRSSSSLTDPYMPFGNDLTFPASSLQNLATEFNLDFKYDSLPGDFNF